MILPDDSNCTECGRKCASPSGLSRHWGHTHPDVPAPWWRAKENATRDGQWWEFQRRKALSRDDNHCQLCEFRGYERVGNRLHVHHLVPYSSIPDGEFPHHLRNLITLCDSCHKGLEGLPTELQIELLGLAPNRLPYKPDGEAVCAYK